MREAAELRKEKERVSRDTNSYLSAMSKWDKENKEEIAPLEQAVQFAKDKNAPNIVIMKEQLAKKRQERMAYEAEVRRAFPDARTSSDAAPAGDVDTSNPLLK
jgi:sulfur relay (sulfurtransferase) DsrC/TusE family protein